MPIVPLSGPGRAVIKALDAGDRGLRRLVDAKASLWACVGIGAAATAVFFAAAVHFPLKLLNTYPPEQAAALRVGMALALSGLFAVTLCGLLRMLLRHKTAVSFLLFLSLAWMATLLARTALFDFMSGDYDEFLSAWIHAMRGSRFADVFSQPLGDYNPPYLYLLYGIANAPLPDLYLIKLLSVSFDYVAAFFVMRLVALKTKSLGMRLGALLATLWLPTVLLNGAHWGQCDALFASLALGGLYFSLTDRPCRGSALFALSLSLKLQAMFLLPLIAPLLAMRKLSLKHLLCFCLTYLAALAPAWIAGQPLGVLLATYVNQAQQYPSPTLGAPSIFALFTVTPFAMFAGAGICLTLGVVAAVCGMLYRRGPSLTHEQIVCAAMLFAMGMPLLLPSMHERYFFAADLAGVVYCFYFPARWYIPFSVALASFCAYHSVYWIPSPIPLPILALMLAVTTALCAMHLARLLRGPVPAG